MTVAQRWAWLHGKVTNRSLGYITAALIFVGIIGLELTAQSVIHKMEDLRNGNYDNSMWIVSQLEVDFQRFLLAVHGAVEAQPPENRPQAIAQVVKSFDIYFSRVEMVSARARNLSTAVTDLPAPGPEIEGIDVDLQSLVPLIDNSAGQDEDYFRHVLSVAGPIAPKLRQYTMTSLQAVIQFDAQVYGNRAAVLGWLLILTQSMVVLLFGIGALVLWLSGQLNRRTVDFARVSSNLNKAIETSLDAVIISDRRGKISTFNSAAEIMFGVTFEEVKGELVEDLLHAGPRAIRKGRMGGRQIAAGLVRSANSGRVRLTLQKSDGSDFMVEVAVVSDVDIDGAPIFLAFLRDISKLVEADGNERAARYEAERSAVANARFLAVMSHEMRTPLHGIISALELLEGVGTPAESATLRKIAKDSAGYALEQIQEVLELSLHDAADVSGVILTFFPIEVARIILEQSQSLAAANHTSLTLTVDPSLSEPMHGNRRAFRSALANLIGNAIKFTQTGTIVVRLSPAPDSTGNMRVEVTDTGIGIEPQHQIRIFDDFETVSANSHETFGVSGLGLGIARRAVGLMGGTLQLESTLGLGSRFWFDVPQSSLPSNPVDEFRSAPQILSGPNLTVLVVDDNPINRLLLAQMLERLGHTVEMASDGLSAVEAAVRRRYDLILMDINMPGLNGVEATRKIRAGGASADVPILGITANALPSEFPLFASAGLNSTLVKPITSATLAMQIQRLTSPKGDAGPDSKPTPLIALESFRDLQAALMPGGFMAIARAALSEAANTLTNARVVPLGVAMADQFHRAAGAVAMIGAHRLHMLLCELEDAVRAGDLDEMESLLDEADAAKHDTDDWFGTADRRLNDSAKNT